MSEPINEHSHESTYLDDTAPLFRSILENVERLMETADCDCIDIDVTSRKLTRITGLPTAEEFLEAAPETAPEEAVRVAERHRESSVDMAAACLVYLEVELRTTHELDDRANVGDSDVPADSPATAPQSAEPQLPAGATCTWRRAIGEDAEGNTVRIMQTKIKDTVGADFASMVELDIEDSLVSRHVTISACKGEVLGARSSIAPVTDPLLQRAVTLLGLDTDDFLKAHALMYGIDLTGAQDVEVALNGIRQNYYGTGNEQEVAALLDDVRVRHLAARDSLALRKALGGGGMPSFQELVDLNDYLAKL